MSLTSKSTPVPESRLRSYLKDTLDDLPNTLPEYDEAQFLDDLTFLLRSHLFLYAISPRLAPSATPDIHLPPTPVSVSSKRSATDANAAFDIARLEIRIRWTGNNWAAQLAYNDNVLLEGRQIGVEQEVGFVQCFFWFVEEAAFLAWEYKAREGVVVANGVAGVGMEKGWGLGRARVKAAGRRRSLKLKIRLRDTARGKAGVWRVE